MHIYIYIYNILYEYIIYYHFLFYFCRATCHGHDRVDGRRPVPSAVLPDHAVVTDAHLYQSTVCWSDTILFINIIMR